MRVPIFVASFLILLAVAFPCRRISIRTDDPVRGTSFRVERRWMFIGDSLDLPSVTIGGIDPGVMALEIVGAIAVGAIAWVVTGPLATRASASAAVSGSRQSLP